MTPLNYRYLKLSNGDAIICGTDDDCSSLYDKKTIHIVDPVCVDQIRIPRAGFIIESFVLTPWIKLAKDNIFVLKTDQIITATEVKDSVLKNYKEFIDDAKHEEVRAEINNTNSDTIENKLANALENLIDNLEDNSNENTEKNERIYVPGSKTVH